MNSFTPDLNARSLKLDWDREGEPQKMEQRVVLEGSEESNFLTICLPPVFIGMSGMLHEELST